MLSAQLPGDPLRKDSMDLAPVKPQIHQDIKPELVVRRDHTLGGGRDGIRAVAPTRTAPSSRMLKKLLERKCIAHIDAINQHDFFEGGAIWLEKADSIWTAEVGHLSNEILTLPQYVSALKRLTRRYPDLQMECTNMETTVDGDYAEVCTYSDVSGMINGNVQRNVSVITFQVIDGRWLATKLTTLPS